MANPHAIFLAKPDDPLLSRKCCGQKKQWRPISAAAKHTFSRSKGSRKVGDRVIEINGPGPDPAPNLACCE